MRADELPIGDNPVLIDLWRGHLVSKIFDAWTTMDWPIGAERLVKDWKIGL